MMPKWCASAFTLERADKSGATSVKRFRPRAAEQRPPARARSGEIQRVLEPGTLTIDLESRKHVKKLSTANASIFCR